MVMPSNTITNTVQGRHKHIHIQCGAWCVRHGHAPCDHRAGRRSCRSYNEGGRALCRCRRAGIIICLSSSRITGS